MHNGAVRVILDTNLWSSLGDDGSVGDLDAVVQSAGATLCVAPSTLLEVLAIPHEDVRRRIVACMARGPNRERMRTEADTQGEEIASLIRRFKPEWGLKMPRTAIIERHRTWWLKRVWREAQEDSTRIHEYQLNQRGVHSEILARQKANREEMLEAHFVVGPLLEIIASGEAHTGGLAGWDGSPVQLWRLNLAQLAWHQLGVIGPRAKLTGEDRTLADWVEPYVSLREIRAHREEFVQMWLLDADPKSVARNWINWAVDTLQWTMRITHGNPADAQHASYLLDCDLFLSADSRFLEILETIRGQAPFGFAETKRVSGDRSISTAERIGVVLNSA